MNKKQLHNNIRIAWSTLLLLIVCCFISNDALAQYPGSTSYASTQYRADIDATDSGGGTWGEILKMNVRLEGPDAMFSITSKKGAFYNTNSVTIRSGSHNGPIVATGKIPPGSEAAKLQLDLDTLASFPQSFFATITNNIGYAWVGPIQISKNETAANEPVPWDDSPSGSGPERPVINESPERAATDTAVNIAVTAGQTHSNDTVRVQCTASGSDNTPSNPYRSNWIYSGDTINVPLTFHSAGTQAIFCNTLDNYGETSSLSQRTIIVTPSQRFSISPPVSPSVSPPARSNISAP
ncbi:MAG: hypothetical protein D3909_15245, partial [Candidatus Electrothrix sp. ATG1]|nr:hypothetical protein [Candidatus Electrothrix sp. ATG1]